jgi:hypothetical protein
VSDNDSSQFDSRSTSSRAQVHAHDESARGGPQLHYQLSQSTTEDTYPSSARQHSQSHTPPREQQQLSSEAAGESAAPILPQSGAVSGRSAGGDASARLDGHRDSSLSARRPPAHPHLPKASASSLDRVPLTAGISAREVMTRLRSSSIDEDLSPPAPPHAHHSARLCCCFPVRKQMAPTPRQGPPPKRLSSQSTHGQSAGGDGSTARV